MGDLNGTLKDNESWNYSKPGNTSYFSFDLRRMVAGSRLVDLGASGSPFTWRKKCSNGGGLSSLKRARLDRCLVNPDWRIKFPKALVTNIPTTSSDHNPIFLNLFGDRAKLRKEFCYENLWFRDPRCVWVVRKSWSTVFHRHPTKNLELKLLQVRK
ncbi:uncharacterized protein LOC133832300 [Humulus lupulus]|uniref:uncharacterized protein LOC133832300 n=1 Tax=Humulus lupulus TaxID=3486 RepID=UPI002B407418|nr:uncharacterized protein LOC133832300 [Humulus lupulus]